MFRVKVSVFLVGFRTSILNRSGLRKTFSGFFCGWISVSETDSLVESQLCNIVFSKDLFGVVNPFSTAF